MPIDPLYQLTKGGAKLRVLLVGINNYHDRNLSSLNYSVADCLGIETALKEVTAQFPQCQITALHGSAGSAVTVETFCASVNRLLSGAVSKDTVLLYFSGHGVLEAASNQLYLCLSDTNLNHLAETAIPMKQVLHQLTESMAGKQVVILDACHSGGAFRSKGVATLEGETAIADGEPLPPNITQTLQAVLQDYTHQGDQQHKHFHALLSCAAGQQSYEMPNQPNSIFSYYLIKGLRGEAADKQGRIHANSLSDYLEEQIPAYFQDLQVPEERSQTPVHLKAGSQKVVLGFVEPFSSDRYDLDSSGYGDTLPSDKYGRRLWKALKQEYPLTPASSAKLRQVANLLFLPPEESERIETETRQRFEGQLKTYQQQATHHLHQHYPHASDPFIALRVGIGLKPESLEPFEQQAEAIFEQHKQEYQQTFAVAIHQHGEITSDDRQALQVLQDEWGFAQAVTAVFEAEETTRFEVHRERYRLFVSEALHQQPVPDRQALQQTQHQLGLGTAVVQFLEAAATTLADAHKAEYQQMFARMIRYQPEPDLTQPDLTQLNLTPLEQKQQELALGVSVVEAIQREETQRFEADQNRYREVVKRGLHQHVDFDLNADQLCQQARHTVNLADHTLASIESEEMSLFEQHCQDYREAYFQALRQEDPIRRPMQRTLKLLQEKLGFFDVAHAARDATLNPVIQCLQAEEERTFNQEKQLYLSVLTAALRQQEPLGADDRDRLNDLQQQFQLSRQVIDRLSEPARKTLKRDQADYGRDLDLKMRQQYPLAPDLEAELQQKYQLGDAIIDPLKATVLKKIEHDRGLYCDAVSSELYSQAPLSPEALQRLQQLRRDLRLGEAICQELEQLVTTSFEDQQNRYQTYEQEFDRLIRQPYRLDREALEVSDRAMLEQLRLDLKLTPIEALAREERLWQTYQQNLQDYQASLKPFAYPLTEDTIEFLESMRLTLNLSVLVTQVFEQQTLDGKLQQYEQEFLASVLRQYPLTDRDQRRLVQLQRDLGLGDALVLPIQQKVQSYVDEIDEILENRSVFP